MKLALEGIGHAFLGRAVFEKIDFTLQNGEVVATCERAALMRKKPKAA